MCKNFTFGQLLVNFCIYLYTQLCRKRKSVRYFLLGRRNRACNYNSESYSRPQCDALLTLTLPCKKIQLLVKFCIFSFYVTSLLEENLRHFFLGHRNWAYNHNSHSYSRLPHDALSTLTLPCVKISLLVNFWSTFAFMFLRNFVAREKMYAIFCSGVGTGHATIIRKAIHDHNAMHY